MDLESVRGGGGGEEEEEENNDDDDDDAGEGWPLGLLPTMTTKPAEASAASSMMLLPSSSSSSESSSSSSSSSDFDAESMGSFFPEDSTSLGTLIGIHSSAQFAFMEDLSSQEKLSAKRRGWNGRLCSLLRCRSKIQEDAVEVGELEGSMEPSPSASHYWSMEQRDIAESAPNSMRMDVAEQQRQIEDTIGAYEEQDNVSVCKKSWMHSYSCRFSLRVASQKPGPLSSWRFCLDKPHHSSKSSRVSRSRSVRNNLQSFWMALRFKLRSHLPTWSFKSM